MFACIHLSSSGQHNSGDTEILRSCASRFSPEAELVSQQTAVFDVSRLQRLYGKPSSIAEAIARHARSLGIQASIAIAPNIDSALLAGRNLPGITVIPDNAAQSLADIAVESLTLAPEIAETLESWGIRTLADVAKLPEDGLTERLGPAGATLHRLARGEASRPLKIDKPAVIFDDRVDLEHPLSLLEPLLFVLASMLNQLCTKLETHGMAANELRLTLELEDRSEHARQLRLPVPMRQSKTLLKLLQLELEAHPPGAAIEAVRLELVPVLPRTVQSGLFLPATPAPDKLEVTLTRIRALVGSGNAGVAELLDTHRPEPFQLIEKQPGSTGHRPWSSSGSFPCLAFRYFHPALPARVQLEQGHPLRLAAGSVRGNVITYAGPWRKSGEWWTAHPWAREEWDVSLNDGAIYRIYRNPDGAWFLEGAYD